MEGVDTILSELAACVENKKGEFIEEKVEQFFSKLLFENGGEEMGMWMDKFESSKPEEHQQILDEIMQIEQIKRKAIEKLLELICTKGEIEEAKDLEKRKYWYENLKKINE